MDQCVEKSAKVVHTCWCNTRAVKMLSTLNRIDPSKIANRYEKPKSPYVQVQQHTVIKLYNGSMGGRSHEIKTVIFVHPQRPSIEELQAHQKRKKLSRAMPETEVRTDGFFHYFY